MSPIIDLLRSKNLVDYIQGMYPQDNLERCPDNTYRTVCKFHDNASNPTSFTVFSNNNCYCFSCGYHSDIIGYVMNREGVAFGKAIEILCDNYGIDLDKDDSYKQQKSIADKNEQWCISYEKHLDKCYDYLTQKRGFSDEIIRLYRFGWSERSKAVTIPMFNEYGQIVSFLYRYFDKQPKYKNGKNNELFVKGSYLYNIDKVPKLIKKNKRLWVCEGAFDAASAYQMGEAALAYCGITFSKEHVKIIKKLTRHIEGVSIILVPDNDGKANQWINRGRDLFIRVYPEVNLKVGVIE